MHMDVIKNYSQFLEIENSSFGHNQVGAIHTFLGGSDKSIF
jgi:hypothetical protein